jgi:hypothetical protein
MNSHETGYCSSFSKSGGSSSMRKAAPSGVPGVHLLLITWSAQKIVVPHQLLLLVLLLCHACINQPLPATGAAALQAQLWAAARTAYIASLLLLLLLLCAALSLPPALLLSLLLLL